MSDKILLAHGGGGRLGRELIEGEIVPRFGEGALQGLPDAARVSLPEGQVVFSTDSFVVKPLLFPGGNIGDLAVHGTVNDISVAGGRPIYLSLGMILEEGLELSTLRIVLDSIKSAAHACGVSIVTGDTKVVGHGQCDGMYLNTAGVGTAIPLFRLSPARIAPGDAIIVSGTLGDHGMAVMAARENLNLGHGPVSDSAPVHDLIQSIAGVGASIRFMRDPTRGGISAVLHEAIEGLPLDFVLSEEAIPFSQAAAVTAAMLGFDLLHSASEGRVLAFCAPDAVDVLLAQWRSLGTGKDSCVIGHVSSGSGRVILETLAGGRRLVDLPEGELLPRIC